MRVKLIFDNDIDKFTDSDIQALNRFNFIECSETMCVIETDKVSEIFSVLTSSLNFLAIITLGEDDTGSYCSIKLKRKRQ